MFEKRCYFLRYLKNRLKKKKFSSYVTLVNNLPEGKKKYVNGSISLCHCRGYNCIIIVFYLDGFFETRRCLFGEYNYLIED